MPYVSGFDRNQLMCCSWDAFVDEESIARIIDAFVEHLDIKKYGVLPVRWPRAGPGLTEKCIISIKR